MKNIYFKKIIIFQFFIFFILIISAYSEILFYDKTTFSYPEISKNEIKYFSEMLMVYYGLKLNFKNGAYVYIKHKNKIRGIIIKGAGECSCLINGRSYNHKISGILVQLPALNPEKFLTVKAKEKGLNSNLELQEFQQVFSSSILYGFWNEPYEPRLFNGEELQKFVALLLPDDKESNFKAIAVTNEKTKHLITVMNLENQDVYDIDNGEIITSALAEYPEIIAGNLIYGRFGHGGVTIGNKIYSVAGRTQNTVSDKGKVYTNAEVISLDTENQNNIIISRDTGNIKIERTTITVNITNSFNGDAVTISDNTGSIESFDPSSGKSDIVSRNILVRDWGAAVAAGSKIYIFGGITPFDNNSKSGFSRSVEEYDVNTGKVKFLKNIPIPARLPASVAYKNKIYIFGGSDEKNNRMKTVQIYNIESNEWHLGKPMLTAKESDAVLYNNKIYLYGGFDGRKPLNCFEVYDPEKDEWRILKDMPFTISAHHGVVKNDMLYVFGDYQTPNFTCSYDFKKMKWEKLDLKYNSSRHNAVVKLNENIYVIGGIVNSAGYSLKSIQKIEVK